MTHAGVVLGTASYMSPEQAKGRVVDRRTDIWAFGCVLFEMLTGKRAFSGDDVSDVMVAILRDDPRWAALPANTPPHVRSLLHRCLQKDPRKRLPHIGVARLDLLDPPAPVSAPAARNRTMLIAGAIATILLAAAVSIAWMWPRPSPASSVPLRVRVELGASRPLVLMSSIALSADGTTLAFVGRSAGDDAAASSLYVRWLDRLDAQQLEGTEGAQAPFFSPDGKWIAFFNNGVLSKISTSGGRVITICDAPATRGGSWSDDDSIVFGSAGGLKKVSAFGGSPESIKNPEPGAPVPFWPQGLPGGRHVIYSEAVSSDPATGTIVGRSLVDGSTKELVQGRFPRYIGSGHLTFFRSGIMFVVPFDPVALERRGDPVPVVDSVAFALGSNLPIAAMSGNGRLVYLQGSRGGTPQSPMMWLSRSGPLTALRESPASWAFPRFSPTGPGWRWPSSMAANPTSGSTTWRRCGRLMEPVLCSVRPAPRAALPTCSGSVRTGPVRPVG